MPFERVKIEVDYKAAGLDPAGCEPLLDCYTNMQTEEMGTRRRRALLIIPGGGNDWCSEREAEPVAFRFLGYDFNCFVLRYSCVKKRFPTALLECAWALRYIRQNAERFDIDPEKIIVMGFSAGGHLAGCMSNFWQSETVTGPLGCTPEDIRPNGAVLAYSVLSSRREYTHGGTILNLLGGEDNDDELRALLSLEDRVGIHTPPTFLWHCADDGCVPVENTLFYMQALSKNKIPFECHIYPSGGHGLSLADHTTQTWEGQYQPTAAEWVDAAVRWAGQV
ncbi:MAG: alpha/beta hydrolase [Ruminococcus sp.]|nr:alpha/beta hydrolase [Ruminococcus sp.]